MRLPSFCGLWDAGALRGEPPTILKALFARGADPQFVCVLD